MTVNELLKKYVNKDYEELRDESKFAISKLLPALNTMVGKEKAVGIVVSFVCSCVAADGELSSLEAKLLYDVMGVDSKIALKFVRDFHDFDFANDLFDNCDDDLKLYLLSLCLCFIAVDETINSNEISFLENLLRDSD